MTKCTTVLSAIAISVIYLCGYYFVVHQRLQNPFVSWPIRRGLPMVAYYQPSYLRPLYEPAVRLEQWLFPKRWLSRPAPAGQYLTNVNLNQLHSALTAGQNKE